jgi:hypothetical protein
MLVKADLRNMRDTFMSIRIQENSLRMLSGNNFMLLFIGKFVKKKKFLTNSLHCINFTEL